MHGGYVEGVFLVIRQCPPYLSDMFAFRRRRTVSQQNDQRPRRDQCRTNRWTSSRRKPKRPSIVVSPGARPRGRGFGRGSVHRFSPTLTAEPLTEEEREEKSTLADQVFTNWNKPELRKFLELSGRYGRTAYTAIAAEMDNKTEDDLEAYAEVYWQRYKEIPGKGGLTSERAVVVVRATWLIAFETSVLCSRDRLGELHEEVRRRGKTKRKAQTR